jgi:hypothetical protein
MIGMTSYEPLEQARRLRSDWMPALRLAGCKPLDGVCVEVKNLSYECIVVVER